MFARAGQEEKCCTNESRLDDSESAEEVPGGYDRGMSG